MVRMQAVVMAVFLSTGCGGGSRYKSYEPTELNVTSKELTFDRAQKGLRERGLLLLEEDQDRGLVSTQWQLQDGKHYNLQILISPVSAKVIIGCRIEHNLTLSECPSSSTFPRTLVEHARAMSALLSAAESPTPE